MKNTTFSFISPPPGGKAGWLENRYCPEHRPTYLPSLIKIGKKMAEKTADKQTDRQTDAQKIKARIIQI
jgi:hypothetical protein